eukprot:165965_1
MDDNSLVFEHYFPLEKLIETLSTILDNLKQKWAIDVIPINVISLIIELLPCVQWNKNLCHNKVVFETNSKIILDRKCKAALDITISKQLLIENNNEFGIEFIFDDIPDGNTYCHWIGFAYEKHIRDNKDMIDRIKNKEESLYADGFYGFTVAAKNDTDTSRMWKSENGNWRQHIDIGTVWSTDTYGFMFVFDQQRDSIDMDLYINGKKRKDLLNKLFEFELTAEIIVFIAVECNSVCQIKQLNK